MATPKLAVAGRTEPRTVGQIIEDLGDGYGYDSPAALHRSVTTPARSAVDLVIDKHRRRGHVAHSMLINEPKKTCLVVASTKTGSKKRNANDGVFYMLSEAFKLNCGLAGLRFVDAYDASQIHAPEDPVLEAGMRLLEEKARGLDRLVYFVKVQNERHMFSHQRFLAYLRALVDNAPNPREKSARQTWVYQVTNALARYERGQLVKNNPQLNTAPPEEPVAVPVDNAVGF
jgi:hypothetical protein